MKNLKSIDGIGEFYAHKLKDEGIHSQETLLEKCASPQERYILAQKAGITEKHLLEWLNRADLARVNGIGEEYADLLEHTGVDTVRELRMRNAEILWQAMKMINQQWHLVRRIPTLKQVQSWIDQAQDLPRMIFY